MQTNEHNALLDRVIELFKDVDMLTGDAAIKMIESLKQAEKEAQQAVPQ